jgi:hypothetical protein
MNSCSSATNVQATSWAQAEGGKGVQKCRVSVGSSRTYPPRTCGCRYDVRCCRLSTEFLHMLLLGNNRASKGAPSVIREAVDKYNGMTPLFGNNGECCEHWGVRLW